MRLPAVLALIFLTTLVAACGTIAPEAQVDPVSAAVASSTPDTYPVPLADQSAAGYPAPESAYPVTTVLPSPIQPTPEATMSPTSPNATPAGRLVPTSSAAIGRVLEALTADLSAATGLPASEITIVTAEAVVWPDAGLGCPDPDRQYAQVMVEGMRITLQAGKETADYHTEGLSRYVRCEDGRPIASGVIPYRNP